MMRTPSSWAADALAPGGRLCDLPISDAVEQVIAAAQAEARAEALAEAAEVCDDYAGTEAHPATLAGEIRALAHPGGGQR